MNIRQKNKTIWVLFFLVVPLLAISQDGFDGGDGIEPPPFDGGGGIEPPPAAPIDDSIVYLWIAGVLFAAYFFFKRNIKIESK